MEHIEYIKYAIWIILILVIFYFAYLSNKKQNKKLKEIQDATKVGDKIITYSGLSGIVVEVLEDRVVIETNPDKIKISIEKWAVAGLDDRDIY